MDETSKHSVANKNEYFKGTRSQEIILINHIGNRHIWGFGVWKVGYVAILVKLDQILGIKHYLLVAT